MLSVRGEGGLVPRVGFYFQFGHWGWGLGRMGVVTQVVNELGEMDWT